MPALGKGMHCIRDRKATAASVFHIYKNTIVRFTMATELWKATGVRHACYAHWFVRMCDVVRKVTRKFWHPWIILTRDCLLATILPCP
jgi:hypothetical protein